MSKESTTQTPADESTGKGNKAPIPVVPDDSVDTENPNDALEAYHERLREQIHKD